LNIATEYTAFIWLSYKRFELFMTINIRITIWPHISKEHDG